MPKGLCCAAQTAGDLGKPLLVTIHKKDGTTSTRCGVCEVRPSCANQSKLVFAFRFLASSVCNLASSHCKPTTAGIAQYNLERTRAAAGLERTEYIELGGTGGVPLTLRPMAIPGRPYALPPS